MQRLTIPVMCPRMRIGETLRPCVCVGISRHYLLYSRLTAQTTRQTEWPREYRSTERRLFLNSLSGTFTQVVHLLRVVNL